MMTFLLALFSVTAACALVLAVLTTRAHNKRRLLAGARGPAGDAPDGIGVSVLCTGVTDAASIENLLAVEYGRYEVIAVLDSRRYPAVFAELVARYRMIRVEYVPTWELPVGGIRALGRSRRRSFRRLVLVDRGQDTPEGDLDAAASVATYDYLLPFGPGRYLLPGAVERLVFEVGERPAGDLALVRSRIGIPAELFAREAVVRAGGFARRPAQRIPLRRRRTLWEPLCVASLPAVRTPRVVKAAAGALLTGCIAAAVVTDRWPLAAALVTAALVWIAAEYIRQLFAETTGTRAAGLLPPLWRLRKFNVKNFTIS